MGMSGQATLEARGSEGEYWAGRGVGVPRRRTLVQSPEAEVCGCAVGAERTVEGEGRGSEGHGVGWTVLWEDLTFSSGRNREPMLCSEQRKNMSFRF